MKKKASKNENAQSATARNRCIWMTAGVISFKLCPLNYDCEHCDFDEAMRSQVESRGGSSRAKGRKRRALVSPKRTPADSKEPLLFFTFSAGEVDEGLYLHSAHLWVRQVEGDKWMLGIDRLLAYVLPPLSEIESYGLDTKVLENQLFGKVHTSAGTVPLTAPVSGRLIQTNLKIAQHPELAQQDPYGEGWLAVMDASPDRSELDRFYTGLAGRRFLEEEAQHLRFLLKHRGIEVDQIGDTLPDGGAHIRYLHQVLPGPVCLRLAVELMASGKQAW